MNLYMRGLDFVQFDENTNGGFAFSKREIADFPVFLI